MFIITAWYICFFPCKVVIFVNRDKVYQYGYRTQDTRSSLTFCTQPGRISFKRGTDSFVTLETKEDNSLAAFIRISWMIILLHIEILQKLLLSISVEWHSLTGLLSPKTDAIICNNCKDFRNAVITILKVWQYTPLSESNGNCSERKNFTSQRKREDFFYSNYPISEKDFLLNRFSVCGNTRMVRNSEVE